MSTRMHKADGGDNHGVVQYDSAYHFPTLISSGIPDVGFRTASQLPANIP